MFNVDVLATDAGVFKGMCQCSDVRWDFVGRSVPGAASEWLAKAFAEMGGGRVASDVYDRQRRKLIKGRTDAQSAAS
jgi:hypothetical protein